MSFFQLLSSWSSSLSACFSHSKDWCLKIDSYKLSASITHRLEVGLTGWGGGAAGKTPPGPLAPQSSGPVCQNVISDKEFCFSRSDGLAWLSKLSQSYCCMAGSGGAPPLCKAQISSYYVPGLKEGSHCVSCPAQPHCVSGPSGGFCCAVNLAQAPIVHQTRGEAPTVCQAPPTCCAQYKLPL